MTALAAENVFISEREVSYLGRKFINYLAIAHRQSQPGLRDLMTRRGGYILHVDGTCEGDSPNLFCGLDEISELVLDTIKIPSEKKEQLVPFFQHIKDQYGEPKALVHDMGRGIIAAVEEVFAGVADFICHFHFLRDLGKDLMLDEYTTLQKHLRKFKVRPLLRQRAKYLEQKINPACQSIDEIIVSIESGSWQTTSFENIPLITTYALIQWILAGSYRMCSCLKIYRPETANPTISIWVRSKGVTSTLPFSVTNMDGRTMPECRRPNWSLNTPPKPIVNA
jgi:hypothetical protein